MNRIVHIKRIGDGWKQKSTTEFSTAGQNLAHCLPIPHSLSLE